MIKPEVTIIQTLYKKGIITMMESYLLMKPFLTNEEIECDPYTTERQLKFDNFKKWMENTTHKSQ